LILLSVGLWGAWGSSFENDIAQLDGVAKIYSDQELNIQQDWIRGQDGQALAVVQGESFEEALEQNDRLYAAIQQEVGDETLASFSVIWKSSKERQKNVDRWNQFWSDERINQLKTVMAEKAEPFGFTADAFEPFW
jgi:hypothetical protein